MSELILIFLMAQNLVIDNMFIPNLSSENNGSDKIKNENYKRGIKHFWDISDPRHPEFLN